MIEVNNSNYLFDVLYFFIENEKVNKFNDRVYRSMFGIKYIIKVYDSVIGVIFIE